MDLLVNLDQTVKTQFQGLKGILEVLDQTGSKVRFINVTTLVGIQPDAVFTSDIDGSFCFFTRLRGKKMFPI